jgi:hypothetical protein
MVGLVCGMMRWMAVAVDGETELGGGDGSGRTDWFGKRYDMTEVVYCFVFPIQGMEKL